MQRKRPRFRAISVLVALCLSIQLCLAQNTANASLEILVRDPSGALINKAQVQLLNSSKPQSAQTNQKGEARFNKLTPGRYQIHVEAPGFKAYDVDAFSISTGINRSTHNHNIMLSAIIYCSRSINTDNNRKPGF